MACHRARRIPGPFSLSRAEVEAQCYTLRPETRAGEPEVQRTEAMGPIRETKLSDSEFWVRVHSLRAYLMASEQISQMRGERWI